MTKSINYLNFDLLLTRSGEHYRAFVIDAPGGEANILFDLPSEQQDLPSLLRHHGPWRGMKTSAPATVVDATPDVVGRQLYETIFQSTMRDVLIASQKEAEALDAGLRLRLRFSEDASELAVLPWELLYDVSHERFLALSERQPILRYLSLPRPRPALVTKPPLSILAILSSPNGLARLDLEAEWQFLCDALAPLTKDGKVRLERLTTPTVAALHQRLLGDAVHVLHFVGHGVFDTERSQGMLVMADEQNEARCIGAGEVATLLANHSSLRLVYLNTCEGALGSASNVFAGLAQRLVQQGAPAAIAMQAAISDEAGIELARTFYAALATGRPVDAALAQARVALAGASSMEWATPVLLAVRPTTASSISATCCPHPTVPIPVCVRSAKRRLLYSLAATRRLRRPSVICITIRSWP
ncbi:MAG: CHAT domain-containing protein [Caldilineaceae bacterium]